MKDECNQVQICSLEISKNGHKLLSAGDIAFPPHSVSALVGPSGSGKTIAAYAILDLLNAAAPTLRTTRSIKFPKAAEPIRTSYVPQGTSNHLQPMVSVRAQIRNLVCGKGGLPLGKYSETEVLQLLGALRLVNPKQVLEMTPAELSGGMLQRILLVIAIMRRPHFMVLDEPTTALDGYARVETYKAILDCCQKNGTATLLLTHSPRDVAVLADRVYMIDNGVIVPAPAAASFRELLPDAVIKSDVPDAKARISLSVRALTATLSPKRSFRPFSIRKTSAREAFTLKPFTMALQSGDCLGVIGESGCGKTTLLRALSLLIKGLQGSVQLCEVDLLALPKRNLSRHRKHFQLVFQDSSKSLNPFLSVRELLNEPLLIHGYDLKDTGELNEALEKVLLPPDILDRQIGEISFGQRQRLVLLRTLTSFPELQLLMLDEPFAGLDASAVQAVIDLWREKSSHLISIIASHNIEWINALCTHVHFIKDGAHIETCGGHEKRFATVYANTFWQASQIADRSSLAALLQQEVVNPSENTGGH